MRIKSFDDWGAYTYDSFLMSIIPSKFFLNFSYMVTGAISSVLLFRIGCHYMPVSYAFVGAMAYGTSSFLIMLHCTFLKEPLFVFFVICAMFNLCRGMHQESNYAYPLALLFLCILFSSVQPLHCLSLCHLASILPSNNMEVPCLSFSTWPLLLCCWFRSSI